MFFLLNSDLKFKFKILVKENKVYCEFFFKTN